ncbi:MAG TPA: LuxR C-terminal-related transcriptional regulator, partial [Thermomicrobiales bacterium]|nr:LuxR C-terminal-related transcriptional regulator [Thermomicrobiales bacterium]
GPLGPLRDLAPALGLQVAPADIASARQEALFRDVLLAFAARPPPTIVIGEDAHWSDGASLDLVRFLARRIDELPLLLIVTYRDDEVGPIHPLRLVLGDLATAPTVHRMTLRPLSLAAVATLAAGSPLDPAALHRSTGGNPFFVSEVLAAGGEGVPSTVGDVVLARAARLSPDARAALDVAATIGASIDLDLLTVVAGPVLEAIDECIASGLLRATGDGLAFRHDLARVAILGAIAPPRRRILHARVLAALRDAPAAERDLARLAHYAEAAGDRAAVLEFATAAAKQAAALHAYREAAAQYARALRFGAALPAADRARLLEDRAAACCLIDQGEEAVAARQAALALWRALGDSLKEGENLRLLSYAYWLQGRGAETEATATAALEVLETLPPGPELAMAYSNLAQLRMLDDDLEGTLRWGDRAIALAEQLGETETLVHALANVGTARLYAGNDRGREELNRSLQIALAAGLLDHAGRALANLAFTTMFAMRLEEAERRLAAAIAFAIEHDLDFRRGYLLATRAALRARQGAWDAAEAEARQLLRQPVLSAVTRIVALTTLGQVGARRGNPEAEAVLDEALALADRNGKLMRLAPVRAARAEAALLRGERERAREEASPVRDLVLARGNPWHRGEFASLLWQAGDQAILSDGLAEPYALQLAGDWRAAAVAWERLGCPYEAARALAEGNDPDAVRQAIAVFERLGARPAATQAIGRLRQLGARDLPRGPRPATRANPAGLTPRELEVLALLAEGLRNAEIADRLYLTPKTVGHHVSAVLAKLGVRSRGEAARVAQQLGIGSPQSGQLPTAS